MKYLVSILADNEAGETTTLLFSDLKTATQVQDICTKVEANIHPSVWLQTEQWTELKASVLNFKSFDGADKNPRIIIRVATAVAPKSKPDSYLFWKLFGGILLLLSGAVLIKILIFCLTEI